MTLRVTVVGGLMAENPSLPYPKETTRTIPHPCRKPDHDSSSLDKVHQPRTILTIISVEAQVMPNKVTDNRNLDTDNNLLLNLLWTRMDILQIWDMHTDLDSHLCSHNPCTKATIQLLIHQLLDEDHRLMVTMIEAY